MTEKKKTVIVYAKKTLMNMYLPILAVPLNYTWEHNMYQIVNVMLDSEEILMVMVDVKHVLLQKLPNMDGVVVQLWWEQIWNLKIKNASATSTVVLLKEKTVIANVLKDNHGYILKEVIN